MDIRRLKVLREDEDLAVAENAVQNVLPKREDSAELEISGEDAQVSHSRAVWDKIGRNCLFALIFLAPIFFLPVTNSPVEINKTFISAGLVLVSLIAYFAKIIETRKVKYPGSLISAAVAAYVLIAAAAAATSISGNLSLFGQLIQPDSVASVFIYALAFFLSSSFLKKEHLKTAARLFFASVGILTLFGVLQSLSINIFPWDFAKNYSFNPAGTTFAWAVLMASGLCMITSMGSEVSFKRRAIAAAILMAALFVLNFKILWLEIAFATIIIAALRFVSREEFRFPLAVVVVSLFLSLIAAKIPAIVSVPAEVRPSAAATLTVAKNAVSGWRAFLGTGPSTFGLDFSLWKPQQLNSTGFWSFRFNQGYNLLFTTLAATGILGFLSLLFILGAFIKHLFKFSEPKSAAVLVSGLLFLLLNWLFYPAFFSQMILIFTGLGLFVSASGATRTLSFERISRFAAFGIFLFALILIAVSLSALFFMGQKYAAAAYFGRAGRLYAKGNFTGALAGIKSAADLDPEEDSYWRLGSGALINQANQIVQTSGIADPKSQAAIAAAVSAAQNAVNKNPADETNWLNLGNIYEAIMPYASGADKFAADSYKKAWSLDPNNPQLPVNLARLLIASADLAGGPKTAAAKDKYDEAEKLLLKSVDLKNDFVAPRFLLAQLYMKEGDLGQAITRVEEVKAGSPFDSGIAFQLGLLYYQSSQPDKAQAEFERAVAIDANYSNARYFLGLIYDRRGQKNAAVEQFQKIADLNPDNSEVKKILANLSAGRPALSDVPPPVPEKRKDVPVPDNKKAR